MPKHEAADTSDFETMRVRAALSPPTDALRREVQEASWAHYGRAVYDHLHGERFAKAINLALKAADESDTKDPIHMIASRLRAFLVTGAL